jgi:excisionase family DNA binding protein
MAETQTPEDIITVAEAAKLLKVSRQSIAIYMKSGRLRAFRLSDNPKGRVRLSRADVLALLTPYQTSGDKTP